MKRVLALLALTVGLAGCHFPQGWHWVRLAANGSSTTQTLVYFQNDVDSHQGPYVAWLATLLNSHPELTVRMVDTCTTGRNCVAWQTGNLNGALTSISIGGERHLVASTVTLDVNVGRTGTVDESQRLVWHEGCHAYGGGFDGDTVHSMCNWEHRSHHMADISRVYHNDPG